MTTFYTETGSTDPYYNLAYEEYLLTHCMHGDIVMLWQNLNTVVVGVNQNAAAEINADFVLSHDIRVVRRTTGGGAVYHDLGNLNYSFITDGGKERLNSLSIISRPIISALKKLGVSAEVGGRNDITVDGKKVSGTAQRIYENRILHHGTLLYCSDVPTIQAALNVDKSKFTGKSTKSVAARVGNICDYMPNGTSLNGFWAALRGELSTNAEKLILTEKQLNDIKTLANNKYRQWEWNFGKSPKFELKGKRRFLSGTLEVHANVENGIIRGIEFLGDYMAKTSAETLTKSLEGVRFTEEEVKKVMDGYDIADVFGGLTIREILSVIFS